jgi:hypothetical protein
LARVEETRRRTPELADLTGEERRSLTHGEFWIPEDERVVYRAALHALNAAGVPYVVSGLYAIYEYTGIYRKTKDLDLFIEPGRVIETARVLKEAGFSLGLEQAHWIAKAMRAGVQTDLIYGMGNGLGFIDARWHRHSRAGILAGEPVRIAPPEELIWHRLYVSERHRWDMADVLHLILCRGDELNWDRLLMRVNRHWGLLLAQVHLFDFAYPGYRRRIPETVRERLNELAAAHAKEEVADPLVCQGTLISRFSFSIDVNEWGFHDPRKDATLACRSMPVVQEIVTSDVWDD